MDVPSALSRSPVRTAPRRSPLAQLSHDPDAIHLTPFLRKHAGDKKRPLKLARKAPLSSAVVFISVFPGMFLGQARGFGPDPPALGHPLTPLTLS